MSTLHHLLQQAYDRRPQDPALISVGSSTLTCGELLRCVDRIGEQLRALGIGPRDRVAIVLPDGILMAATFLGVASCATAAPLNPRYGVAEYAFYLADLQARALLVATEDMTPARQAAVDLGIPAVHVLWNELDRTLHLRPLDRQRARPAGGGLADGDAIALILHTSGTTARPKMVPLTHGNLAASARNIGQTLALSQADRCLNIMPLFHIHGLLAGLLAPLAAGGGVICAPGFHAGDFFTWMAEQRPTWYTAVPTMHQAILSRAADHRDVLAHTRLRFIRSSSASLPPPVMAALEATFGAPVIESYGMTEAAHQMASNPLPPAPRKPGSVGLPAGPEIAIMEENGPQLLSAGAVGEIVIRGANVMAGYVENAEANAAAFTAGWLRTGDLGNFDADGYLFIVGRRKEIINRAGEKIAPREVDEALLSHPSVAQAVAFAVPDPLVGEEVVAAVVLQPAAAVTERALRQHVAGQLAAFKIPRHILFVDEIPKGPTGKLQRVGLAERLGFDGAGWATDQAAAPEASAEPAVESFLVRVWCEVLALPHVDVHTRFTAVGGDSIQAMRLLNRINSALDLDVALIDLLDAPTIAWQALVVQGALVGQRPDWDETTQTEELL